MYAYKNSGLTKEQLTSLGVTGSKDSLAMPIQAPLFPPTLSRPLEIDKKLQVSMDYKLIWLENFRSRLNEIHSNSETVTADSFSSKVANALEKEHKKKLQFKLAWSQMPTELRPMAKRKSTNVKPQIKKLKKVELIEKKLEILEQKEKLDKDDDEKSNKADNESDEEVEDEEKLGEDAELDDETDYINNYFDNGDGYFMDEDDNLGDDGPVY